MKNQKIFLMSLVLGLFAVLSFWSLDVKADSVSDTAQAGYYTYSNGYQYYVLNDGSYYYWEYGQWIYVPAQEPVAEEEPAVEEVSEEADTADQESSMEDIYNCWCWPIIGKRYDPTSIPTFPRS